jgi:MerR family redox-sensitive transcriptional activator SoxR
MAADSGKTKKELSIGELADRSGVPPSALHFYERKGLITAARTAGNQRRYSRDTLRRVAFIRTAQRVGISLASIREALDLLPDGRTPTREDWAMLSERWHDELDLRIRQLERLRDNLAGCIGCGCLSIDLCPVSNPDDAMAELGPGARNLEVEGLVRAAPRPPSAPTR